MGVDSYQIQSIKFEGLFVSFNSYLLLEQIMGVVICFWILAIISFVIFKVISYFTSLRVDSEHEGLGLDAGLHGESAYKR